MLNSRHWALISYALLTGLAIVKDIIGNAETFTLAVAPLAAAFAYDKITSLRQKKTTPSLE